MTVVWNWAPGCACTLALIGCGRDAIVDSAACDGFAPGDLVITEVHANPDGSDGDGEYIELFNATGALLALDGLTLAASRADGASPQSHRLIEGSVVGDGYVVLGNAPVTSLPEHIHYSYGASLGSLRNSDVLLAVRCGGLLIDQVHYDRTADGRALEFDGRLAPDHELNDDAGHWCTTPEGVAEFSEGNFGTPGSTNSPCETVRVEGLCVEDGSRREIRVPEPDEVRITEWMANPEGADADFEWVEAYFDGDADLNGFQLGPAPDTLKVVIDQEECFPVGAGARVVFGASPAAAPRVDASLKFSLGNSGPRAIIAAAEGVALDRVDYDSTVEGVAWQLDPYGDVCLARADDEYLDANFGTPGMANPECPIVLSPGMCFDQGTPRQIVNPRPEDATITEWMANPLAVGNREGEWVEVRFDAAVDLNGLALSDLTDSTTSVQDEDCLRVTAGTHVVFARNPNPAENGGVEAEGTALSLSLNNTDESITLSVDGRALDSVSYARSNPGVATQIDDEGKVCDAVHAYGDGDLGTPGLANPWCF